MDQSFASDSAKDSAEYGDFEDWDVHNGWNRAKDEAGEENKSDWWVAKSFSLLLCMSVGQEFHANINVMMDTSFDNWKVLQDGVDAGEPFKLRRGRDKKKIVNTYFSSLHVLIRTLFKEAGLKWPNAAIPSHLISTMDLYCQWSSQANWRHVMEQNFPSCNLIPVCFGLQLVRNPFGD